MDTLAQPVIQMAPPDYVLFPGDDPLMNRPRSHLLLIFRVRLIPRSSSMIRRHYWNGPYPPPPPRASRPGSSLARITIVSPIHSVPSVDSMDHISASSSIASDDDRDDGLLALVLGPLSIGAMSGSSYLLYYSAIDSPAGLPGARSRTHVPHWRFVWEGSFLSELGQSDVGGFDQGCAFRNTTYRPSDFAQPSGKYGFAAAPPEVSRMDRCPEVCSLVG